VLAGEATALGAAYRSDAVEMPPCRPLLKGRAAIEQCYRGLFQGAVKIAEFTFSYLETVAAGDVGYTTGTYKQKPLPKAGRPIDDSAKFVVVVKRNAGVWKAAYVIYNSDHRPRYSAQPCAARVLYPYLANTMWTGLRRKPPHHICQ
jgi:ketosteroid isomerase-like protein